MHSRRELLAAVGAVALTAACGRSVRSGAARSGPSGAGTAAQAAPSTAAASAAAGTPPAGPAGRAPAGEIDHGPRTRPMVALTFHGSGDLDLARALLAEVERAGARVTVFAVGRWLAGAPAMAARILDGGHELANHTWAHLPMAPMGERQAYAEAARCADALQRLTGSRGRWFRPSGTPHTTAAIRAAAGRAGYRVCVGYDVDSLDYTDPGAAAVRRRTLGPLRAGSVVSMHLGHAGTVEALPGILDGIRGKGLSVGTVTEVLDGHR